LIAVSRHHDSHLTRGSFDSQICRLCARPCARVCVQSCLQIRFHKRKMKPHARILALVAAILLLAAAMAPAAASSMDMSAPVGAAPTVLPPLEDAPLTKEAGAEGKETFVFQAEVSRLMDIIINSLYSNKDIFLRELISNASDALDKVRFLALTTGSSSSSSSASNGDDDESDGLDIRVTPDASAQTLTIQDSGVGMTRTELIENLGTIARSGTSSFLDRLGAAAKESALKEDAGSASHLIGQFGVGFYSAYLVADRVRVESKVEGGFVHVWESGADESFVVYPRTADGEAEEEFGPHGTRLTLFLKPDAADYLSTDKLKELIQKYSQFISFPIYLQTTEEVDVPVKGEAESKRKNGEEEKEEGDDDDDISVADEDGSTNADSDVDPEPKTRKELRKKWSIMNENKPVWTRDSSDVSDDEYKSLYDSIAKMPGSPMARSHFRGEGEVEFRSILYIPDKAPVGLHSGNVDYEKDAIRLYVRRVLLTDKFEEGLLPRYLAFIVGIVDSDDLPINVSREMLQQSKTLDIIKRKLIRKALEMMRSLAKKEADEIASEANAADGDGAGSAEKKKDEAKSLRPYVKFWKEFGKSVKLGIVEDTANRARLAKLLRFRTSKSNFDDENDWSSLDQYLDRMKEDQDNIYYHSGEDVDSISNSPFLEKLLAKGYEVLYLTEGIDEHVVQQLPDYEGTKFMSVAKDNFKFGEKDQKEEKDKTDALRKQYKPLTRFLKKHMVDKVSKVRLSNRLSNTPCVLSTEQWGYSARMEIVMKAQAFANPDQFAHMTPKTKIMELNPHHPIVRQMLELVKGIKTKESDEAAAAEAHALELGHIVYDTALVSSGYLLADSSDFAKRMYKWIGMSIGVDGDQPVVEIQPESEEEKTTDAVDSNEDNSVPDVVDSDGDSEPFKISETMETEAEKERLKAKAKMEAEDLETEKMEL
jgi:heat shock protein 90kDa beta